MKTKKQTAIKTDEDRRAVNEITEVFNLKEKAKKTKPLNDMDIERMIKYLERMEEKNVAMKTLKTIFDSLYLVPIENINAGDPVTAKFISDSWRQIRFLAINKLGWSDDDLQLISTSFEYEYFKKYDPEMSKPKKID